MSILSKIPRSYKLRLKAQLFDGRVWLVNAVLSYDTERLRETLRSLGVQTGDSVMLHSAFGRDHGFRGSIEQLTDAFIDVVGPEGHLLMVSLPYRSSSLEYLRNLKHFDVRNTPSMMGLVSEFFRRRGDVLRSAHPTHPVLVRGPRAEWFVADHPDCLYPCGPGSPFDKLAQVDGKVVFFNVPFDTFTFFHHLEHLVSPQLPFRLYADEPFRVPIIDGNGEQRIVTTYVFSLDAISRRRFAVLEAALRQRGSIQQRRIGNSRIQSIRVRDAIDCAMEMSRDHTYFYDMGEAPAHTTDPGGQAQRTP
jgi:aminoglycoside 3-N-acetyltransferase